MDDSSLRSRDLEAALAEVGHVAGPALTEARTQLHHAAQVVAAVGFTYLPAEDDDSHTNLEWLDAGHLLLGRVVPGDHPVRAGLSLPGLSLRVRSATGHTRASFDLPGRTLDEAYAWMAEHVERRTHAAAPDGTPDGKMVRPSHDLPDHPVTQGAKFGGVSEPALSELSGWFSAAHHVLSAAAAAIDGASAPVTWPHHFDTATLVVLRGAGEDMTSIGLGFSPGDAGIDEPYFYVNPWPAPGEAATLPALEVGGWHTQGWTGALLRASQILAADDERARAKLLARFIAGAEAASRRVLA